MNQTNEGLTVGELTITVAVMFLIFIAWSAIGKKGNETKTSSLPNSQEILINSHYKDSITPSTAHH